jgi:N-glycosylase/DNA lyase
MRDYFQLDIDLDELYKTWSGRDPIFRDIQSRFSGIRILRQDPWENLVSYVDLSRNFLKLTRRRFICSSNNNISRISKMVKSLCNHYSAPLVSIPPPGSDELEAYHPFPPPTVLAAPEVASALRGLGFGYRADFIQKTSKMLIVEHGVAECPEQSAEPAEQWLTGLRKIDTAEARAELVKLMGVGRKVADCVLLMSLDKV